MENQTLKKTLMILLDKLDTLEDIEYLEDKIRKTPKINRRTKLGRELTMELTGACNKKIRKIISTKGILPF